MQKARKQAQFQRAEIMHTAFFGHSATNLELRNPKVSRKSPNI